MARNRERQEPAQAGPVKGEFIAPPEELSGAEVTPEALPCQEEFWRPPVRFGTAPVEKEPLGWDRRRGFRKLFPAVMLPTRVVERVEFCHLEPNRLFWGDNLHVMRQLASQSIDLISIDPPFFSGRQYNVIFCRRCTSFPGRERSGSPAKCRTTWGARGCGRERSRCVRLSIETEDDDDLS